MDQQRATASAAAVQVCERIRQYISPPAQGHVCRANMCWPPGSAATPQSEPNLVRQGIIPPSADRQIFPHIFLLSCRTIHVCTEDGCPYWRENQQSVCPISNMEYGGSQTSSYNKGDSRTWYIRTTHEQASAPTGAAATPRPKTTLTQQQIEDRCGAIIKLLLWSRQRVDRNKVLHEEQSKAADLACSTYLQKQAQERQPPFFTDVYRIRAYILFCEAPLQILEFDESRFQYYVAILSQVWQRVQRFYVRDQDKERDANAVEIVPRLDFDSVILATLYGMRLGYHQEGVRIIPYDAFLKQHLPLISDLITHFALPRDAITKGQRILRRSYENAFLDKVPVDQIELDSGALVAAVPQVYEERIEVNERNQQFKITKSGERLFMPTSRRGKDK